MSGQESTATVKPRWFAPIFQICCLQFIHANRAIQNTMSAPSK